MATLNYAKTTSYYSVVDNSFHKTKYNSMYSNKKAIDNTIRYVTRTGDRMDRADELIGYGCSGCCTYLSPEDYIQIFKLTQKFIRGDRQMSAKVTHEILTFGDKEEAFLIGNKDILLEYARVCAEEIYYKSGFLAVFGIHYGVHGDEGESDDKRLHIHFIINNVNYNNGNLFHSKIGNKCFSPDGGKTFYRISFGTKEREAQMNSILYTMMGTINPYQVSDPQRYFSNAYRQYPGSKNGFNQN